MNTQKTWLWTAMITPFTADSTFIDYAAFGKLLRAQEAAGNGVLILGSTGESLSLSDEEKKEIVRFTLAQKLKVPVMVGTPNVNLVQALAWFDFCRGQGINAYLAATPVYTKPATNGQIAWFTQILEAADAPVMLYNVPSRAGTVLQPAVLAVLRNHKNFWAVKESSGGLDAYIDYFNAAPNVALYCGDDNLLASSAPLGACGLVSVASNVWPDATHAYVTACRDGSYRSQIWWQASKALFTTTSPVPLKALMHEVGLVTSDAVRVPLSRNDLTSLDQLKSVHRAIEQWHSEARKQKNVAA